jgi:hypothetical protein
MFCKFSVELEKTFLMSYKGRKDKGKSKHIVINSTFSVQNQIKSVLTLNIGLINECLVVFTSAFKGLSNEPLIKQIGES